jgi:hypothetical protein
MSSIFVNFVHSKYGFGAFCYAASGHSGHTVPSMLGWLAVLGWLCLPTTIDCYLALLGWLQHNRERGKNKAAILCLVSRIQPKQ